jgi:hypothetical protein
MMRTVLIGFAFLASASLAEPARAQQGPDLADLVVGWASGSLRSPISCEIDGTLRQGVRRVIIEPEPIRGRAADLRMRFIDLHPGDATRCVDTIGRPLPNLIGGVRARYPGRPHPETAKRDFREALKRKKGFELDVIEGTVQFEPVGAEAGEARLVDFTRGKLVISRVYPATDPSRELAPFKSGRKFLLTLKAPSGEALTLPVFDPAAR